MAGEVTAAGEGLRRYRTEIRNESRTVFAAYLQGVAHDLGLPVTCDARTVARWEDGDVRWPHGPYRRLLETATGRELADLGFSPRGAERLRTDDSPEPEAEVLALIPAADWVEVHRRTLLAGAATGLAALAGWKPFGQQRDLALGSLSENPHLIDPETAADVREIALRYRRSYRSMSPTRLMPHAFGHLQLVLDLRPGDQPSAVRTALVTTLAEMASLIGTMWSLDRREFATGGQYLRLAARAAREAEDPDLESFVLGGRAFHEAYSGDLAAGLHYIAGARLLAQRGTSRTNRGWLAAVASELHASAGMEKQCQLLLEEAESHLAEPDATPWVGVGAFNRAKLRAYRGGAMRRLGRYPQAETTLTTALDELSPSMLKHRGTALIDLAETHALARDADRSANRALEALALARRTGHEASLRRVHGIHRHLETYAKGAGSVERLAVALQVQ